MKIPDKVLQYGNDHPTALCVVTFVLLTVTASLLYTAMELDIRANDFRKARLADVQIAASEALGG
jgi:hypothetical protein